MTRQIHSFSEISSPKWPGSSSCAILLLCVAVLSTSSCAGRSRAAALYPDVAEHAGAEIDEVRFLDPEPFVEVTLKLLTETKPSHCSLLGIPFCIPGTSIGKQTSNLSVEMVARDATRLTIFYRRSGFFGTRVAPIAEPADPADEEGDVRVDFQIQRGDSVMLDTLDIEGAEGLLDIPAITRTLPLKAGELFDLSDFDASADTVLQALLERGRAYAQVLRQYDADTIQDRASATLVAVPGPLVMVDSIAVIGASSLGRRGALRQMLFKEGDVLKRSLLAQSQRNLYALELIQFASVEIAPDSMIGSVTDTARATVVVRVSEGPVHVVEAEVGYGTVECMRARTRWVSRSFMGGARRLALNGSVSKVGIGAPLNFGLGRSACQAFEDDPFQDQLDYQLSADLTQPYFFDAQNQATLGTHVERQSEPQIFQRQSHGARFSVTRRLNTTARLTTRDAVTGALEATRGRTLSSTVVFCLAFQVCTPEDVVASTNARWRNAISGSYVMDRTNRLVDPTDGFLARASGTWATPLLGSELKFLRTLAEASAYRPIKEGWVVAGFLRLGNVWRKSLLGGTSNFLPPEERFYAGGAYSVRGFERNGLGPVVYFQEQRMEVEDGDTIITVGDTLAIPLGGTSVVVANAEVRFPSPIFSRLIRLAAFVDAGAVDTAATQSFTNLKFTPGIGVRLTTPVGPVRADIAYNPYGATSGALYTSDPRRPNELIRINRSHTPETSGGFFRRIRFHLAVGQPF